MLKTAVTEVWNGVLDLLYPPVCLVCGRRLESGCLCVFCVQAFRAPTPPFCDRCGVPVSGGRMVCEPCEDAPKLPFAWSQTLGTYSGTLRDAIHRLKYAGKQALAEPLGVLLARSLDSPPSPLLTEREPGFDCVVPVPLHPARYRERGFNQSERLAAVVARERGWTLDTENLRRVRRTAVQAKQPSAEARAANVQGAFAVSNPSAFANRSILLVDDVFTTLSTIKEAAFVLQTAGVRRVCVVALAQ